MEKVTERYELNKQLAQMPKGGVIMDVTTPEQAKIAEAAGACAGLILLASEIEGQETSHFATLPVKVRRNAYGRQLGSFHTESEVKGIGKVPMTFIRAPYVSETSPDVEVLAVVDNKIVGVRYNSQFAYAFHPELDDNTQIHELFLRSISAKS